MTTLIEVRAHPAGRPPPSSGRGTEGVIVRTVTSAPTTQDPWIRALTSAGPDRDEAIARLHALMVRAARHQVARMAQAASLGSARRDEIVQSTADEATVAVLARLQDFEGRSRFTTWAYKFAILQAGVQVRREAWRDREIDLEPAEYSLASAEPTPADVVEGSDLARAVRAGIDRALTAHQRTVMVALLARDVPIDVLAERMGTSRGALYKTMHEGRKRLRAYLIASGFGPDDL